MTVLRGSDCLRKDFLTRLFVCHKTRLTIMKTLKTLLVSTLIITLSLGSIFTGRSLAVGNIPDDRQSAFSAVIQPWIKGWFTEHSREVNLADDVKVERKLISSSLYRFEDTDGQEKYSVTILYYVIIFDRPSKVNIWGLKEQQVVFLLKGANVVDYLPLSEYWKGEPQYSNMAEAIQA